MAFQPPLQGPVPVRTNSCFWILNSIPTATTNSITVQKAWKEACPKVKFSQVLKKTGKVPALCKDYYFKQGLLLQRKDYYFNACAGFPKSNGGNLLHSEALHCMSHKTLVNT